MRHARRYFILTCKIGDQQRQCLRERGTNNSPLRIMSHDKDMSMVADYQKDARYSEKRKHLLASFRARITPAINTISNFL